MTAATHALGAGAAGRRASALAIACVITCLAVAAVYLPQSVFPLIARGFGLEEGAARLTFTYASIAYGVAFFVVGPWTDRLRPRVLASAGLLGAAAALVAASVGASYPVLLVAMALTGGAAAMVPAAMFSLVPRMAPPQQLGSYFGVIIAASVVGISIGRALPGLLAAHLGWRGAFQVYAAVLAGAALAAQWLAEAPAATVPGEAGRSWTRLYADSLGLLATPGLSLLFLTGFALFFGYLGCVTFLTYRLYQAPFNLDSVQVGAVGFLGLVAVVGAPLSGALAARIGPRVVALFSLGLTVASVALLGQTDSLPLVMLGVLCLFLGVFSCQPAVFALIASQVAPQRRGASSSMYLLTCFVAGSAASWSLGPLWARYGFPAVTYASAAALLLAMALMLLNLRQHAAARR
jgi:YNFM family putative membrane transporter